MAGECVELAVESGRGVLWCVLVSQEVGGFGYLGQSSVSILALLTLKSYPVFVVQSHSYRVRFDWKFLSILSLIPSL